MQNTQTSDCTECEHKLYRHRGLSGSCKDCGCVGTRARTAQPAHKVRSKPRAAKRKPVEPPVPVAPETDVALSDPQSYAHTPESDTYMADPQYAEGQYPEAGDFSHVEEDSGEQAGETS